MSFASILRFTFSLLTGLLLAGSAWSQYPLPLDNGDYADSQQHIFLPDEVMLIEVTMDPADLAAFIADPYINIYANCTVRFVNSVIDETLTDVGIRPRGNTARDANKFPWKFSFNEFVPGRKFHGLKRMNLGGDAPDPTLSRSSVIYKMFRDAGVPASRTHHAWVKINDGADVEGVFIHFEQVDDEFVQAWFDNDTGDLYKCRNKGGPADLRWISPGTPATYSAMDDYDEEINGANFVAFAEFVDFINNSDDATFAAEIGQRVNVDGFLRAMAVDMVTGQWDGYWIGANNYYLYQNMDTGGRFEYIPWDLDHCFGMDYLLFPIIGNFGTNFAIKDYNGWGNRGFGSTNGQLPPLIRRILEIPIYDQTLQRYAREINETVFKPESSFDFIDMLHTMLGPIAFTGSFVGSNSDGYDNADLNAGFTSPSSYSLFSNPATWGLKPFIERRTDYVRDTYPIPTPLPKIYINEVMAKNDTTIQDEAGDYDDWVEIYNDEDFAIDLSGTYISDYAGDPRKWQFPAGTTIQAKGHLIVWCDEDPGDGPLHTNFKLSGDGEGVYLWHTDAQFNKKIDSVLFPAATDDVSYGRFPNGLNSFQEFNNPTPGSPNLTGNFELVMQGDCPGILSAYAGGATPSGWVAYWASFSAGNEPIPAGNACAGLQTELGSNLIYAGRVQADGNGTALLQGNLPANLCGQVFLQALDETSCTLSPVANL